MALSPTEAYFITRTVRALEVLASGPHSAPQLAAALQIHPRTARRMLYRLADEGYVTRIDKPRPHFALTPRLATVAGGWLENIASGRSSSLTRAAHARTGRCRSVAAVLAPSTGLRPLGPGGPPAG
jgi:DNA-binding IclR family transcriptional regulator